MQNISTTLVFLAGGVLALTAILLSLGGIHLFLLSIGKYPSFGIGPFVVDGMMALSCDRKIHGTGIPLFGKVGAAILMGACGRAYWYLHPELGFAFLLVCIQFLGIYAYVSLRREEIMEKVYLKV